MSNISRRAFMGMMGSAGIIGAAALVGCGAGSSASASGASGSAGASGASKSASSATKVVVGTLATEDILPLWVAEAEGLYADKGVSAEIVEFQSATELIAGVASGEVNMAMTDIMVTASMFASGIDVQMQWVTLGTQADQGRFGIMAGPGSSVSSLKDLAGIPIGVGSNTILEYVMDCLMETAGVAAKDVVVEELQKLPVRYQAMVSGEVAAAALPGTLLALGEANGCKLVADDTKGDNISQSVMIARGDFLGGDGAQAALSALKSVWNEAAKLVNADPEAFRSTLVKKANLPDEIAGTYPISTYPECQLPTSAMVDPVLDWMSEKGYLTKPLSYDAATGCFAG